MTGEERPRGNDIEGELQSGDISYGVEDGVLNQEIVETLVFPARSDHVVDP